MFRGFKVDARVGRPQVAYKEAIREHVRAEGRFVRQSGGRGQYGHVWIEMEPLERGSGVEVVNKIVGGVVPREYIPAAQAGIKDALQTGAFGYPVIDVRVSIVDGSYHEVDSSEIAFRTAGSMAVKAGIPKARPVILEPVMKLEVSTPEDFLGDVIGDLSSRRGQVTGIDQVGSIKVVHCNIPLATTFGYSTDLRSMTQGRATHSMEFLSYSEMPSTLVAEVAGKRA